MVYVSKRLPASMKTTSLSKPWESVARTQRRRERACDGSPSRKTNWPVLRISALSRLYPGGYARSEVSGEVASPTCLGFDLVVWLSKEFSVSTFQAGEEASSRRKKGGSAA